MFNFKTLALTALTALSVAAPAAQAGYTIDGVHLMNSDDFGRNNADLSQSMISSLTNMGIPVVDGGKMNVTTCIPDRNSGSYVLGFYSPVDNFVVICTNVADRNQQFETLTHEVVHVIQDARKGIHNDELDTNKSINNVNIIRRMSMDKYNTVRSLYPAAHWAAEFEAFHYQDKPAVVATELIKWAW